MKAARLREQSENELDQLLRDQRGELFNLKVKRGTGDSSTPPMKARILRRDIARIETVLRERKVGQHG